MNALIIVDVIPIGIINGLQRRFQLVAAMVDLHPANHKGKRPIDWYNFKIVKKELLDESVKIVKAEEVNLKTLLCG